jgi:hypothetical protein
MPLTMRVERTIDRPDTQALLWGPLVLQILGTPTGSDGYWHLSLYKYLKRDGDYSRAAITQSGTTEAGDPLFTTAPPAKLTLRPYYVSTTEAVSSYFRRVEPEVVFGSIDTGVANRKRNDGLPRYDVPVANVTSPGTDGPTFLDLVWDQAPFATHAKFVNAVKSTVREFVAAGVYSAKEADTIVTKASKAEKELAP